MPFVLTDHNTGGKSWNEFQRIFIEIIHFILFDLCFLVSIKITSNVSQFFLIIPSFLLIYTSLIYILYTYLIMSKSTSTIAMILYSEYTKYIGQVFGGTQWLVLILRQFGAQIGTDVIIDNISSLYDVHLISIADHVRLSSTCQIQVKIIFFKYESSDIVFIEIVSYI